MNPLRGSPHPLLLEIPVRPWLRRLSAAEGRPLTLAGVPDATLRSIRERGFHGVWLMGAWATGSASRRAALRHRDLVAEYERVLPDWEPGDVGGSPYSIVTYELAPELGPPGDLAALRRRLHAHGLGLVLDFVPNHMAVDHPWVVSHPERFVRGTARDLARDPDAWFANDVGAVFAHGRDPWFPAWTDTCQVDYRVSEAREAMASQLVELASQCDGARCDMAMLMLPDIFHSTWGPADHAWDFWPAAVERVRAAEPDFVLIAEVYWGLDGRLREAGFDFTYDKDLYDELVRDDVDALRHRFAQPWLADRHRVRFLENHDERRAFATFGDRLPAAATLTYGLPGMRFFHLGQEEGRALRTPVQLTRQPDEPGVAWVRELHEALFRVLRDEAYHAGRWERLEVTPDAGAADAPPLLGGVWRHGDGARLVVANPTGETVRARLRPPGLPATGDRVTIEEQVSRSRFEQDRSEMTERGFAVELARFEGCFYRLPVGG